ncbi:DUF7144 family membrane protein [Actinomadura rugatobispora]|uniref:DUF7144 domain-containing protein n=1 Tax=Actinomadura rugatobispora TaxID=1994 RepID=A0ABW1A5Z2_9ACTN|nr:hypothetical protein GCM10010200_106860 [Actinomadura rugatobispora]
MSGRADQEREMVERPVSGWAVGFAYFAACVMVLAGIFGAIVGVAAILKNDLYVVRGDYVFSWDLTTWGWIHLVVGIFVAVAGFAVIAGQAWARTVGIILAGLSAVANFMFLPYYPVWSVLIIVLDVVVIWALVMYTRQYAVASRRR